MDTDLKTDWINKMSTHTASPMYARQNGKPVVCIWMATSTRPVSELLDIVNWFKGQGVYVILGVPRDWRTVDATKLPVYNAANMLSPWLIGSVGNIGDANNIFNTFMVPDQAYCNAHGIDYQPVVLPGDLRSGRFALAPTVSWKSHVDDVLQCRPPGHPRHLHLHV